MSVGTMSITCPACGQALQARTVEHVGGVNDYGWWILECGACGHVFSTYIGRDVMDSSLESGGEILAKLDRSVVSESDVEERVTQFRVSRER